MKRFLKVPATIWKIITWVGLASIPVVAFAQTEESAVAVVVNLNNPVQNLTVPELRKIFSGEKHFWANGAQVKLFVRASQAHERVVMLRLVGMSETEYKKYWATQVFRGDAQNEPDALFSNGMQKEAITIYPGGVAFVDLRDVRPGMKIVKLDGHLPGERGYPLD